MALHRATGFFLNHKGNEPSTPQLNSTIINLSSHKLSPTEESVLNKGLKFIPTPSFNPKQNILNSAKAFQRRIELINFFHNKPKTTQQPFIEKSDWNPPEKALPSSIRTSLNSVFKDLSKLPILPEQKNFSTQQSQALKTLKNNPNLVIKKADKGSATVLMDKKDYIQECERQLQDPKNYKLLEKPLYPETSVQLTNIVKTLNEKKFITSKQVNYLLPKTNCKPRQFYALPKIHKDPLTWPQPSKIPPGRPIVSDVNSDSYHIAEFIDHYLAPLATQHPAYLKDTTDFVNKIKHLNIPQNSLLVTLDVTSMYTNIDNKAGLKTVKDILNYNPQPDRPDEEILQLLQLSLENNDFEFNGKWYVQTSGTAMGKKFAPSYANIFMAAFESDALNKCKITPLVYLRFLDDIFLIWTGTKTEFDTFLAILNSHHPSITLTANVSETEINFLDTTVYKGPEFHKTGKLDIKVFFKPTDTHQLLHKSSFHPKHSFKGIIKSQILRFHRICTRSCDFNSAVNITFKALRSRNYSYRFLRKIKGQTLSQLNTKSHTQFFVKPCHTQRCATCPFVPKTTTFQSSQTSGKHDIPSSMDCSTQNIIYLITCTHCGIQYVGQTSMTLRERFTRHKFDIIHTKDKSVSNHFNQPNHTLDNINIIPIEQVLDSNHLLTRETFWISKLKTNSPFGLNNTTSDPEIIPLVIQYNSTACKAANMLKQTYLNIQQEFPHIFKQKPITAFSKNTNISNYLIRSKLGVS